MHVFKLRKPLAFFDLETTGVNIIHDRIVEIAIVKAMPDGSLVTKTHKVNPGVPIPLESSLIHGIYEEDIRDAPTFRQLAKQVVQFLEGCDLAGYNIIKFDVPILVEEFLRADTDFSIDNRRMIDAQRIYHLMEPRTLSAAVRFYCTQELENAHSAEADTLASYHVLNAQIERYEGVAIKDEKGNFYTPVKNDMDALHEITNAKVVDLAGRFAYNAKGVEVFNFGKHKDKPILEVLKNEPSYYEWMMNGEFPLDTKRKLTEIRLRGSGLQTRLF
ncbi:MAG: 3'-5' exonuclease [Verrucomicrobia bacterium]|nr:3'-5' exonuclease [Cytophagales bacterium]